MSLRWVGLLVEQVAAPEHDAVRRAAPVAAQVDDERVGPGDELHRGGHGRARDRGDGHPAQVEVADVAVEALHPVDAEVVQPPHPPHGQHPRLMVLGFLAPEPRTGPARPTRTRPARTRTARTSDPQDPGRPDPPPDEVRARPHPQVLVVADLVQVAGEQLGQRRLVQVVVLARRQPRLDGGRGPLGDLGEHVVGAQQLKRGGDDLAAGHRLAVIRQLDPRGGGVGVIEGELQQPGLGQPGGQLPAERRQPRPVRVLERGQGLLVLRPLARRRDEHPHHELAGLDGRVVVVLEEDRAQHRAVGESLPQLAVDDPLDPARLGLVHLRLRPGPPGQVKVNILIMSNGPCAPHHPPGGFSRPAGGADRGAAAAGGALRPRRRARRPGGGAGSAAAGPAAGRRTSRARRRRCRAARSRRSGRGSRPSA